VIGPTHRSLPDNIQQSPDTDIIASGGIRTRQSQQASGRKATPFDGMTTGLVYIFFFFRWRYSPLWALACPFFPYLSPTLSIFSLPALEDLFLLLLSIFSWVFLFFSFLSCINK
jgi:hypothetical protein